MHPILFHINVFGHSLSVHSYGVLLMLAFLASVGWVYRTALANEGREDAIDPNDVLDASVWMILAGVIGARALFIAIDWKDYSGNPASWFQIWQGGISFHGALIGGLIAMIVYCRMHKIPILRFGDICAAPVMLGYAIGRIGCFFNGCCYGAQTNVPWAVNFNDEGHMTGPSHPTQIYATIISTLFFAALVRMYPRRKFDGQVFCWYMIFAGIERFVMEIWRASVTSTVVVLGLTDVQLLCLTLIAGGSISLALLRRRAKLSYARDQQVLGVVQS